MRNICLNLSGSMYISNENYIITNSKRYYFDKIFESTKDFIKNLIWEDNLCSFFYGENSIHLLFKPNGIVENIINILSFPCILEGLKINNNVVDIIDDNPIRKYFDNSKYVVINTNIALTNLLIELREKINDTNSSYVIKIFNNKRTYYFFIFPLNNNLLIDNVKKILIDKKQINRDCKITKVIKKINANYNFIYILKDNELINQSILETSLLLKNDKSIIIENRIIPYTCNEVYPSFLKEEIIIGNNYDIVLSEVISKNKKIKLSDDDLKLKLEVTNQMMYQEVVKNYIMMGQYSNENMEIINNEIRKKIINLCDVITKELNRYV